MKAIILLLALIASAMAQVVNGGSTGAAAASAGTYTVYVADHTLTSTEFGLSPGTADMQCTTDCMAIMPASVPALSSSASPCVWIVNNSKTFTVMVEPNSPTGSVKLNKFPIPIGIAPTSSALVCSTGTDYTVSVTKGPQEDIFIRTIRGRFVNFAFAYNFDQAVPGSTTSCPGSCSGIGATATLPPLWDAHTSAVSGTTAYSAVSEGDSLFGAYTIADLYIDLTSTTITNQTHWFGNFGGVGCNISVQQPADRRVGCAGGHGGVAFTLKGGTDTVITAVHASSSAQTECTTGVPALAANTITHLNYTLDKVRGYVYYTYNDVYLSSCTSNANLPDDSAWTYFGHSLTTNTTAVQTINISDMVLRGSTRHVGE